MPYTDADARRGSLHVKWMCLPVGTRKLVASDTGLAAMFWDNDDPRRVRLPPSSELPDHPILVRAEPQLSEYVAGGRPVFDLPMEFVGTDFQKRVCARLLQIPFGETRTYGEIARHLGNLTAMRAVGAANGRNPLSIVAPCHRVIGAGGLKAKACLLQLQSRTGARAFGWLAPCRWRNRTPNLNSLYANQYRRRPCGYGSLSR